MRNLYTWRVSSFLKFSFTTRLLRFMKDEWMFQNEKMVTLTGRSMTLSPGESIIKTWLDERCGSIERHFFFYFITNFPTFVHTLSDLIDFSLLSNSRIFSSRAIVCINFSIKSHHFQTSREYVSKIWNVIKAMRNESQFDDHLLRVTANLSKYYSISMFDEGKKKINKFTPRILSFFLLRKFFQSFDSLATELGQLGYRTCSNP